MERRKIPATSRSPSEDLAVARRRIAVRLTVQSLQGWHGKPEVRDAAGSLEHNRALRRQPWRRPPLQEPVSMLETIRRVEARLKEH